MTQKKAIFRQARWRTPLDSRETREDLESEPREQTLVLPQVSEPVRHSFHDPSVVIDALLSRDNLNLDAIDGTWSDPDNPQAEMTLNADWVSSDEISEHTKLHVEPDPFQNGPRDLTLNQFFTLLARSGLFESNELSTLQTCLEFAPELQEVPNLVEYLIKEGKLTRFQAERLLSGEQEEFMLGNYLILDQLGVGGMGMVFKACHKVMKRIVALKAILPNRVASRESLSRFYREMQVVAKLSHPNIVTAFDAGVSKGIHYLAMEYIEGHDLSRIVRGSGPLPLSEAIDVVIQASAGLEHAHQAGITHRDIKPANLLRDPRGRVVILDLGLARLSEDAQQLALTQSGAFMGTSEFLAPEQALNIKSADFRSDVYGLGCTFFYIATGKTLFKASSLYDMVTAHNQSPPPRLSEHCPGVDEELEAAFQKMVAKQPCDRQQSMGEVARDFYRIRIKTNHSTPPAFLGFDSYSSLFSTFPHPSLASTAVSITFEPPSPSSAEAITLDAPNLDDANDLGISIVVDDDDSSPSSLAPFLKSNHDLPCPPSLKPDSSSTILENRKKSSDSSKKYAKRKRKAARSAIIAASIMLALSLLVIVFGLWIWIQQQPTYIGSPTTFGSPIPGSQNQVFPPLPPSVPLAAVLNSTSGISAWNNITTVAWAPDDLILAVASQDRSIVLWDSKTARPIHYLKSRSIPVALAFTSITSNNTQEQLLLSGNLNGSLEVWNLSQSASKLVVGGLTTTSIAGHGSEITAIAISSDNKTCATAGRDKIVRLWSNNWKSQQRPIQEIKLPSEPRSLAFLSNSETLAIGCLDGLRLIDLKIESAPRKIKAITAPVWSIALRTQDSGAQAIMTTDQSLIAIDLPDGKNLKTLDRNLPLCRSVFVNPASQMVGLGWAKGVRLLAPNLDAKPSNSAKDLVQNSSQDLEWFRAVAHASQPMLATVKPSDRLVQIWNQEAGEFHPLARVEEPPALGLTWRQTAVGGDDSKPESIMHLIYTHANAGLTTIDLLNNSRTTISTQLTLALTPNTPIWPAIGHCDEVLAVTDGQQMVAALRMPDAAKAWKIQSPEKIGAIFVSPDQRWLTGGLNQVMVWNMANGALQKSTSWSKSTEYPNSHPIAFAPNGSLAIARVRGSGSGSGSGSSRRFEVALIPENILESPQLAQPQEFKTLIRSLPIQARPLTGVFSRDGQQFWCGCSNGEIVSVNETQSDLPPFLFTGHAGGTTTLDLSKDGLLLASGGNNGAVSLWKTASRSRTPVTSFQLGPEGGAIRQVRFDSSETHLVVCNGNGSIYVLDISRFATR